MYKGKFDQSNRQSSLSVEELLAQRNSASQAAAKKAEKAPVKKAAPAQEAPRKQAPVKKQPEAAPKKKGPRMGGVIFYTFYFMFILLFFVAVFIGLNWLRGWLTDYEAAQPTVKAEEVFQKVFADPDWAALYDAAGITDSEYEGREEYVAYMESRVADQALSYMETSAGLSDNRKYFVNLGSEKIASFTLVPGNEITSVTDIPNWKLGDVEVFYERSGSVRVQKMENHVACVNGVPLTDDHTIQIATTKADEYLPAGTQGFRTCIQELTGLLGSPEITVFDEKGQPMEVIYDEETGMYVEQTEANTMTSEQREVALNAVKTYALWMIEEVTNRAKIAQYFDPSSDPYNTIVKLGVLWMQDHNGYEFTNESVTNYARYSDDLFSAKVSLTLNVTRKDGSVKETPVVQTLFFEKQAKGNWLCFQMVAEDVSQPVGKVRLTFMDGETVVHSQLYDTDVKELVTPMLSIPDGKVFSGWVLEEEGEDGSTTLTVVFTPDELGNVKLPNGSALVPMTLHALFEDAE